MMALALAPVANVRSATAPLGRRYKVTIIMVDGSVGEHEGVYAHGVDATTHALDLFPDAKRVSAKVVPAWSRRAAQ
jgi:hypothetical protein